jgi:dienelactone hydrolase
MAVQVPPLPVADARPAPNSLPGRLRLPQGAGPFPVVILLHGCNGAGSNLDLWADRLAGWGYGTLAMDSLTPRSIRSVCPARYQPLVTRRDQAGDTVDAALFLRTMPGVDASRIGVVGFSHGGAAAAAVTGRAFQDAAAGLIKAAVDFYGPCRDPDQHGTIPLLALAGEDDTWGDPARRCESYAAAVGAGQPVEVKTYPGVVHDFDNPAAVRRRAVEGHFEQFSPEAAQDSYARVRAFLDRYVGRRAG